MRVDIANLALAHLGQPSVIVSLDPPSGGQYAAVAAQMYHTARAQLLAMHAWGFAQKRVTLADVSASGLGGWTSAKALPSDCMRLVDILTDANSGTHAPYETAADGVILTGAPLAAALYVSGSFDDGRLPPLVVDAFSRLLAYLMAGQVMAADGGTRSTLHKQYQAALIDAVNADCSNHKPVPLSYRPASLRARG